VTLFGRDNEVGALARSPAKVTMLVGDSGVGKTEVLTEAQAENDVALAPAPIPVRNAPGALQRALLEALGEVVTELTRDESAAERIGRLFFETAKRAAATRLDELAAAVGRQLLGIVRRRVSDEAADVLEGFARQMATTKDQELAARIAGAADLDVVDVVIALAGDVMKFAGDRPLCLALDDCDRLGEADRRRIMDLAELLPEGMSLKISFATSDQGSREQATELRIQGVTPIELEGLDESAVREWLTAEGLNREWASEVTAATNGYPVYISAAVGLLRGAHSTAALEDLQPRDVLRAETEKAWAALDLHTRVAAARLAAFDDRLGPAQAAEVLGIEAAAWGALQRELAESGIFTGTSRWFHQLRRRHLWSHVLSPAEKDDAVERAITYLTPQLVSPTVDPAAFVEYARLLPEHSAILVDNPKLAAAAAADRDEVAIAASLIELATPTPSALLAENVLLYARQFFGAEGDLVAALRRLAERDLVHLASNRVATAVVPLFQGIDVVQFLAGRAARELRRLPLPQVATALFETKLRARLGDFRIGHYGVGAPRVAELSQQGVEMQRVRPDRGILRGRQRPNLLLRLQYGALPIYATLAYEEQGSRDEAANGMDGFSETLWERPLIVTEVIKQPLVAVPSLRFLQVLEHLTGANLANPVNSSVTIPSLDEPIALDEEMQTRAATLGVVRDLCERTEILAYGLERPTGYLYFGDETRSEIVQVVGRPGTRRLTQWPAASLEGGFHRVEVARLADLDSEERLGLMTWRQGQRRGDPVVSELAWLSGRARQFNEYQNRVPVLFDEAFLQRTVSHAVSRLQADAAEFIARLTIQGLPADVSASVRGRTTYLVFFLDEPSVGFVPGANATAAIAHLENDTRDFAAHVKVISAKESASVLSPPAQHPDIRGWLASLFGLEAKTVLSFGYGDARHILAELLGHRESELSFQYGTA
jgi:hypothetical protein